MAAPNAELQLCANNNTGLQLILYFILPIRFPAVAAVAFFASSPSPLGFRSCIFRRRSLTSCPHLANCMAPSLRQGTFHRVLGR